MAYDIEKASTPNSYHLTVYAEEDNFFTPEGGNPQPKLCVFTDLSAEMSMRLETRRSNGRWYCSLLVEVQDFKGETYVVHVVYEKSVSMIKISNSSFQKHNQSKQ